MAVRWSRRRRCGPGRDAAYFTDFGFQVTGIDASAEMIEEAKRRVTNVTFTRMPLESLTFTEQSFDGIWAMASLLHIPRSAAPDALKGFHRVLKPSGILFLGMKTGKEEGIVRTPEYLEEPRWFVYYTLPDLLALLAAAGFTVLRADPEDDDGYLQIFAQKAPPGAAAPPAP